MKIGIRIGALIKYGGTLVAPYLEPLAVSDFKNGIYSIGGVPKAVTDLWYEDLAWSPFNPAADIVAGKGLGGIFVNGKAPRATPALFAASGLINGATFVYEINQITADMGFELDITNVANNPFDGLYYYTFGPSPLPTTYINSVGYAASQTPPTGRHKIAITFTQGACGFSIDAGAVILATNPVAYASLTTLILYVIPAYGYGANPEGYVEKLTIYPPQAIGALQTLSAQ